MKTVGYLKTHVKTIYHQNVLNEITKFHKSDIETTLVTHYLLSQYGTKKGIKLFGERGMRAIRKELEQLHGRKAIQPRLTRDQTDEQKIRYLSL